MKSLVQSALGAAWDELPSALKAHYRHGDLTETGTMTISYPWFMQILLNVLGLFGVLVNRRGDTVGTLVEKTLKNQQQTWHRTLKYPDGKTRYFNSVLVAAGDEQLIEFVNPYLGLKMKVRVSEGCMHYVGVCFILKLGRYTIRIPEWLALGHTSIKEVALDETHFAMDFRITHPLFGETFRYAGVFEVDLGGTKVDDICRVSNTINKPNQSKPLNAEAQ